MLLSASSCGVNGGSANPRARPCQFPTRSMAVKLPPSLRWHRSQNTQRFEWKWRRWTDLSTRQCCHLAACYSTKLGSALTISSQGRTHPDLCRKPRRCKARRRGYDVASTLRQNGARVSQRSCVDFGRASPPRQSNPTPTLSALPHPTAAVANCDFSGYFFFSLLFGFCTNGLCIGKACTTGRRTTIYVES